MIDLSPFERLVPLDHGLSVDAVAFVSAGASRTRPYTNPAPAR